MHLYLAINPKENTIDFYLHKARNQKAAKHFFKRFLQPFQVSKPHLITVDKNPAYPMAIAELKKGVDKHQTSKTSN